MQGENFKKLANKMGNNIFVTFEGIEACGKSTQTRLLSEYFLKNNINSYFTREPGGTKVAEEIRNLLVRESDDKLDGITELLLNFAARRDHITKVIKPNLEDGKIVISDRFFDSTFAYQGFGFGVDLKIIENIKESVIGDFAPDITFLIDIDLETSLQRIANRDGNNKYEKLGKDFYQRVRNGFLKIAKNNPNRFIVIDGEQSPEKVFADILHRLPFRHC